MRMTKLITSLMAACGVLIGAGNALAADAWPARSIRWIVPYVPGGTTDILARIMGARLGERLGQTIVVDNRPGAGNNIGTEIAIRAVPDGYTWFLTNPANAINATLYPNLTFNFLRDMAPGAGLIRVPNVMIVPKNAPAKNVQEFIAQAKANPGKLNFTSGGVGTSVHLSGELFKAVTGTNMVHIAYKGSAPALVDLMAGQMHVMFENMPGCIAYVRAGDLRALGVTTAQRSPALPNVPTIAETLPGFEASAWFGLAVPKGTPEAIVSRINREVNDALKDPKMLQRLADLGGTPIAGTPTEFWALHTMETEKWAKVVKASGAKVQ
ncbi:MAG: tripartite tricarboxylate transporter substrate binding protein [Burkholderiales bacterium]